MGFPTEADADALVDRADALKDRAKDEGRGPPAQRQAAWLIEAPGTRYLAARKLGSQHDFHWTADPHAAVGFVSMGQADLTMMAIRHLAPDLFAFAALLGEARPVEHVFLPSK